MKARPDVLDWSDADSTARRLATIDPTLVPLGPPQRLSGGLLNYVWRVPTGDGPRIIKVAPPFVAQAREIALDPDRIHFEADALALFSRSGPFAHLAGDDIRPPGVLRFFPDEFLLVLEDLGDLPHLQAAAWQGRPLAESGRRLGAFIGALHGQSSRIRILESRFRNTSVQSSRRRVQYAGVAEVLLTRGGPRMKRVGRAIDQLGERLLEKGRCLLMGDLWPASILLDGDRVRLIDWEFVHFGQAYQDLAHLLAHTWMLRQRAPSPDVRREVGVFEQAFLNAYGAELGETAASLWDASAGREARLHFAAEILVRTIGPFRAGGLYEGLDQDGATINEAIQLAVGVAEGDTGGTILGRMGLVA